MQMLLIWMHRNVTATITRSSLVTHADRSTRIESNRSQTLNTKLVHTRLIRLLFLLVPCETWNEKRKRNCRWKDASENCKSGHAQRPLHRRHTLHRQAIFHFTMCTYTIIHFSTRKKRVGRNTSLSVWDAMSETPTNLFPRASQIKY